MLLNASTAPSQLGVVPRKQFPNPCQKQYSWVGWVGVPSHNRQLALIIGQLGLEHLGTSWGTGSNPQRRMTRLAYPPYNWTVQPTVCETKIGGLEPQLWHFCRPIHLDRPATSCTFDFTGGDFPFHRHRDSSTPQHLRPANDFVWRGLGFLLTIDSCPFFW